MHDLNSLSILAFKLSGQMATRETVLLQTKYANGVSSVQKSRPLPCIGAQTNDRTVQVMTWSHVH